MAVTLFRFVGESAQNGLIAVLLVGGVRAHWIIALVITAYPVRTRRATASTLANGGEIIGPLKSVSASAERQHARGSPQSSAQRGTSEAAIGGGGRRLPEPDAYTGGDLRIPRPRTRYSLLVTRYSLLVGRFLSTPTRNSFSGSAEVSFTHWSDPSFDTAESVVHDMCWQRAAGSVVRCGLGFLDGGETRLTAVTTPGVPSTKRKPSSR